jgi:hypothetical protein
VYYHPGNGQNVENGYYTGDRQDPYPWNFDYCYFVMYAYQWYAHDALIDPYTKGIPLQVAAAGKNLVTVIPCNVPTPTEFGVFLDVASVAVGVVGDPGAQVPVGWRVGADLPGAHGVGRVQQRQQLLDAAVGFVIEPSARLPHRCGEGGLPIRATRVRGRRRHACRPAVGGLGARSARRGLHPGRRAGASPARRQAAHPPHVTVVSPTRTSSVLPIASWRAARDPLLPKPDATFGWQETHQVVSAMMLTHALGTSGS